MVDFLDDFDDRHRQMLSAGKTPYKKYSLKFPLYERYWGFRTIFCLLLAKKSQDFHIVETGCVRDTNYNSNGASTLLFQEFVQQHGGSVNSVDISMDACTFARELINTNQITVHCDDSLNFLSKQELSNIDLFYLDSYDLHWRDDTPSAEHHLKEFKLVEQYLNSGAMVAIDDNNFYTDGQRVGKGRMIVDYLADKGIHPRLDEYIIIYKL